jgi:hypothetical protein
MTAHQNVGGTSPKPVPMAWAANTEGLAETYLIARAERIVVDDQDQQQASPCDKLDRVSADVSADPFSSCRRDLPSSCHLRLRDLRARLPLWLRWGIQR